MKKIIALIICLTLLLSTLVACTPDGCAHRYVDGTCKLCQETDPNYKPAQGGNNTEKCSHRYVNGVCTSCQATDSNYVANTPIDPAIPCAHNYVDGICAKCQDVDANYVAPTIEQGTLSIAGNGKYLLADENGNYGGTRNRSKYGDGAPLNGKYDQVNSTWYETNRDFYNMKSTKLEDGTPARTIYTNFSPYQQTMANTSGIAGMVAVLNYWGETVTTSTELELFNKYEEINGTLTSRETAQGLANLWNSLNLGYTVQNTVFDEVASARADTAKNAMAWFQRHLDLGEMLFVHMYDNDSARWKVIIGYDNLDTTSVYDDVLIFADSYDNYDHYQDGYSTVNAVQFVQWWLDVNPSTGKKSNEWQVLIVQPKVAPTINRVLASEDSAQVGATAVPENTIIRNWGQSVDTTVSGTVVPGLVEGSYGGHYVEVKGSKVTDYGSGGPMNGARDHYVTHNYYKYPDFANIQPIAGSRWYLPNYRAFSQTMSSSCGHCTAFSMLMYYGYDMETYNEVTLVHAYEAMHKKIENVSSYTHASKEGYTHVMAPTLESMGIKGVSGRYHIVDNSRFASKNIDAKYLGETFATQDEFFDFIKENLSKGQSVGISWRPSGGHWTAIIGYDDCGTPDYIYDDVIIMADSSDTWDHYQEGHDLHAATKVWRQWWSLRFDYRQDWFVIDRAANGK